MWAPARRRSSPSGPWGCRRDMPPHGDTGDSSTREPQGTSCRSERWDAERRRPACEVRGAAGSHPSSHLRRAPRGIGSCFDLGARRIHGFVTPLVTSWGRQHRPEKEFPTKGRIATCPSISARSTGSGCHESRRELRCWKGDPPSLPRVLRREAGGNGPSFFEGIFGARRGVRGGGCQPLRGTRAKPQARERTRICWSAAISTGLVRCSSNPASWERRRSSS